MIKENIFMLLFFLCTLPIFISGIYYMLYKTLLLTPLVLIVSYIAVLLLAPLVLMEKARNLEEG